MLLLGVEMFFVSCNFMKLKIVSFILVYYRRGTMQEEMGPYPKHASSFRTASACFFSFFRNFSILCSFQSTAGNFAA